jgi:hypothetical protein
MVDYERRVGVLELKHVFIYFISSSEAAIKIFPTTLSLAFVYDTVGVGFFLQNFQQHFFHNTYVLQMDTLFYRKHFDHMLKYLAFDITDKAVARFHL